LIGEEHLTAETPLFTGELLKALRPAGYSTYATETGPESTRLLMEAVADGGVAAGEALLTRFPLSLVFLDRREELRVAAEAQALGYDVWGIDQEFMDSPRLLLHRLTELTADRATRELVQRMLEPEIASADQVIATGERMTNAFLATAASEEFDALEASFPDQETEAGRIVQQLRASAEIYQLFFDGRRYDNNATRVDLIKRNYLAHLHRAGETALSDRKAVIKMGNVHAGRGRTPVWQYDIGNFASELAIARNGESFHVMVLAAGRIGPDGAFDSFRPVYPYLALIIESVPEDQAVVLDLKPLRSVLTQLADQTSALRQLEDVALRYDALVVLPAFHRSTAIVPVP
jgi:hypothetical protein